jgi:hypothetical protein
MKILTVKNALIAAAALPVLCGTSAFALTISTPMSLSDSYIIGTIDPITPGNSLAQNVSKINTLLGLTGPDNTLVTATVSGRDYATMHAGYSGSVSAANGDQSENHPSDPLASVPAGFDIVEAKYGPGVVVFYLGGSATTLPTSSASFVFANGGQPSGLSDWRAYNGADGTHIVPPEGTPNGLPDGGATMLLLGGGVSALAMLRRKLS